MSIAMQLEFHPTDRIHLDDQSYVYLGQSETGYLFCQDDGALVEVPACDIAQVILEPGRFRMEREHFKKERRK